MKAPHQRSFDHENDFWLLQNAEWTHTDTGLIVLRVTIKDRDDDSEHAFKGYEAHLTPGGKDAQTVHDLMSRNKEQQKAAWNKLRSKLEPIPPHLVNN